LEIEKAVEAADTVIVFLSNNSVTKEGYVQRELRFVLRIADFKPEGTVFVIPIRLDDCPMPRRLSMWQYVDYFPEEHKEHKNWAYQRLLFSLRARANRLDISTNNLSDGVNNSNKENKELEAAKRLTKIKEIELNAVIASAGDLLTREREEKPRLKKRLEKIEREEKARKEKEVREKAAAEERARMVAKQRVKKEWEDNKREIAEEKARKDKEDRDRKGSTKQASISKQNLKSYVIGGFAIVAFIGFIFGGAYIFGNLSSAKEPTLTKEVAAPTNPPLSTGTSGISQPISVASSTLTPNLPPATLLPTGIPPKDPSIGSTWVHSIDSMKSVYVPGGEFVMGSEDGKDDEKPVHTVYLDAFWIDQSEVTNAMYSICVQAGECNPPNSTKSYTRDSYYGKSEFDNYPVIYVSWNDAQTYCEWAGRRLPTEDEWEKVAGWDENIQAQRLFPWGNAFDDTKVNFCDNNCLFDFGSNGRDDDGYIDTAPVGSYPAGRSFYGAFDMAGNVREWVADWYDVYPGGDENSSKYFGQKYRVLRGGAWNSDRYYLHSVRRNYDDPTVTYPYNGFRCVMDTSE
jgi:formylglycine-generating enzyme required for sulfatase activity